MFREAVKAVTNDEAFKLPSAEAKSALETAMQVMKWMEDVQPEKEDIEKFIDYLFQSLLKCFSLKPIVKNQKENMWKAYHQLQMSSDFKRNWLSFLNYDNNINSNFFPTCH